MLQFRCEWRPIWTWAPTGVSVPPTPSTPAPAPLGSNRRRRWRRWQRCAARSAPLRRLNNSTVKLSSSIFNHNLNINSRITKWELKVNKQMRWWRNWWFLSGVSAVNEEVMGESISFKRSLRAEKPQNNRPDWGKTATAETNERYKSKPSIIKWPRPNNLRNT